MNALIHKSPSYYWTIPLLLLQFACSQPNIKNNHSGSHATDHSHIVKVARQQLGTRYQFGGNSPDEGFDCSGLVYYSYLQAGISLPRTTLGQLKRTQPIARRNLRQGDLIFFRIYRSRVSHVGIYLGNNRFIHAPSSGKTVTIASLLAPYWQKRFVRAGRI